MRYAVRSIVALLAPIPIVAPGFAESDGVAFDEQQRQILVTIEEIHAREGPYSAPLSDELNRLIVLYVENGGEFTVPRAAVRKVHDSKVILDAGKLDKALLRAVGHAHDSEDPKLVG